MKEILDSILPWCFSGVVEAENLQIFVVCFYSLILSSAASGVFSRPRMSSLNFCLLVLLIFVMVWVSWMTGSLLSSKRWKRSYIKYEKMIGTPYFLFLPSVLFFCQVFCTSDKCFVLLTNVIQTKHFWMMNMVFINFSL